MAFKRIIPCMDIKDKKVVKGINFIGLKDIEDPVVMGEKYYKGGCDELVFLDISATIEGRKTILEVVEEVSSKIFIPFTVGGGISTLEDMKNVIKRGADKVSINTAAFLNPSLISKGAEIFGSQCITVAIDAKKINNSYKVFTFGGTKKTEIDAVDWAKEAQRLGAGEILLTSIDKDGTRSGYDIDLLKRVCKAVDIPVIASGGCGSKEDILEVFTKTKATGALGASIFHYGIESISETKKYLMKNQVMVNI